MNPVEAATDIAAYCRGLAERARGVCDRLSMTPGEHRDAALRAMAEAIASSTDQLIIANRGDLEAGRAAGLTDAMLDRLALDPARVAKIAASVRRIADQDDPLGGILEGRVLPNGIRLQKVRVPIGVVLIIFESRPNVTADAAALCLKSGNAVILRGGKEARHTNEALAAAVRRGLDAAGIPREAVQMVEIPDREAVGHLLRQEQLIDLCIPRGGESLIRAVVDQARIPVIKHYTGNCHTYVDADCDPRLAVDICVNAKTQRPGVCNATETILVHDDAARGGLLAQICGALRAEGVEIRGDARTCAACPDARPAQEEDWGAEYLDLIVAVRVVDSMDEAIEHINHYGSHHTDAIVTKNIAAADGFARRVDSGNVFVNCSTRFSDGGEYGLGAEIGISTDKLHARGPMGAADLTTYKWIAWGDGQLRT